MEWLGKGLLTMAVVALVLALARRWGGGAAGLVAGLPTTTAPALGWMAFEHGPGFASEAAVASVAGCAMLAAFALAYARASACNRSQRAALAWGCVGALLLTGPVLAAGHRLLSAAALALAASVFALVAWPWTAGARRCTSAPWQLTALTPAAAGAVSVGSNLAGSALGGVVSGLLASVPVISISVAVDEYTAGGPAAVRLFLRGTVAGLFGRVAFCAVFAATVSPLGVAWAMGLAAGAAGAISLALIRWAAWRRRCAFAPGTAATLAPLTPRASVN